MLPKGSVKYKKRAYFHTRLRIEFNRPEFGRNKNINVDKYGQQMNDDQTENISRYGGPIRNINFQGTSMLPNPYPVSQLDWTPFRILEVILLKSLYSTHKNVNAIKFMLNL